MKTKRNIALAALGVALGTILIFTQAAWSDKRPQPYKLEGAWIAKVVGAPLQWTYALVPDSSGRSASISGSIQVHIPPAVVAPGLFADLEYNSPIVGEIVMTGPDTTKFTAVWYGMKKGYPFNQIVCIGVNSGWTKFTDQASQKARTIWHSTIPARMLTVTDCRIPARFPPFASPPPAPWILACRCYSHARQRLEATTQLASG